MSKAYASKVIKIAKKEVGYQEKKSNALLQFKHKNVGMNNYTKYGKARSCNGSPWCDAFVDWCFIKAYGKTKAKELLGGFSNYTPESAKLFKIYIKKGEQKPKVGDVIFFYSSSMGRICHTGLVYKVENNRVYTIEGNTSGDSNFNRDGGQVAYKSYSLNEDRIHGYGRPKYDKKPTVKTTLNCKLYKKNNVVSGNYCKIEKGSVVTFVKDCGDGWSRIKYKTYAGYVKNTCLSKKGLSTYRKGVITATVAPVRKKNKKSSEVIARLPKDTKVTVISVGKYWTAIKVVGKDGFVFNKKIKILK